MSPLGVWIDERRLERGFNLKTLAERVGVSRDALYQWRAGRVVMEPKWRWKLIEELGLDEAQASELRRLCDELVLGPPRNAPMASQ